MRLVVCSVQVGTVCVWGVSIRHKGQENLVSGALPMVCSRSRGGQGRHLVTFQRAYTYWQVMGAFVDGLEERSLIRYTFGNDYSQNVLIVHCHNKSQEDDIVIIKVKKTEPFFRKKTGRRTSISRAQIPCIFWGMRCRISAKHWDGASTNQMGAYALCIFSSTVISHNEIQYFSGPAGMIWVLETPGKTISS